MSSGATSKYLAVSREIELRIQQGEWRQGEPLSARRIAEEQGVSTVTAARALQVLRDRGLIQTFDRRGSYLATESRAQPVTGRWAACFHVSPGPWYQASLSSTRSAFQAVARRQGAQLDCETLGDGLRPGQPELRRRVRQLVDAGASGLFLLPSRLDSVSAATDEALIDACQAARLPVVLIERNLRGTGRSLEQDLVAIDDADGGACCTRHLWDQGRRRIALVIGSPTSSHEGRLAGYLQALYRATTAASCPLEPFVFEQPSNLPLKAAYQRLADRVQAERIDGVVCFQDYTAIGLILELLTRGVRIPDEVALTGFDDLPIGDSFALGVTSYAPPPESIAEEAFRVMRRRLESPEAPPIKVLVSGRLIVRESSTIRPGH